MGTSDFQNRDPMLLKQTGWVPIGTFLTFGSLFIFQGECRFSLHIYSFENCYWSPIWFRRFLSFWYVLHICRDLFCVTLVKFEFFDQQFSCLSHLLLDIDNEISIAVIEVKHCPTLGCFGQYSDFFFLWLGRTCNLKYKMYQPSKQLMVPFLSPSPWNPSY